MSDSMCERVIQEAIRLGLAEPARRPLLLHGYDPSLSGQLRAAARPNDQLRDDVQSLSAWTFEDQPALGRWLRNALGLHPGTLVFEAALRELGLSVPSRAGFLSVEHCRKEGWLPVGADLIRLTLEEGETRSSLLLHRLLVDRHIPAEEQPLCAFGHVAQDGQTVVAGTDLAAAVEAFRRRYAAGLMVSGPLALDGEKAWKLREPSRWRWDEKGPWVIGASLAEIEAKLLEVPFRLQAWNGRDLPVEEVPRLEVRFKERPEELGFYGNDLTAALRALGGATTGVFIEGGPGSGKSILSRHLVHQFRWEAPGAFGYAVHRRARDLIDGLSRPMEWVELLAAREPERRGLFGELARTHRLVVIVDGLDEIPLESRNQLGVRLRTVPGHWICTGRNVQVAACLPAFYHLTVEALDSKGQEQLIRLMGREDLPASSVRESLRGNPLMLALVAGVLGPGEVDLVGSASLFERVFARLLELAQASGRLSVEEADQLAGLAERVVGELALAWLQSPSGSLEWPDLEEVFEAAGLAAHLHGGVRRSLEFGHLLFPVGSQWEFVHRQLAEWCAARALQRRVRRRCKAERGRDPAAIEQEELAPFLQGDRLVGQDPWREVLRFYIPGCLGPLVILDRLIGPDSRARWQVDERYYGQDPDELRAVLEGTESRRTRPARTGEVLESWGDAFELFQGFSRWQPAEARLFWALGVRRWLFLGDQQSPGQALPLDLLAPHLPANLEGMTALIALTPAQREHLARKPTDLLPFIPAAREPAVRPLLERDDPVERLTVLEWYVEHALFAPIGAAWMAELPARVDAADGTRAVRMSGEPHDPLPRLEWLVWKQWLSGGGGADWSVVRQRILAWPAHLVGLIEAWFGRPVSERGWAAEAAVGERQHILDVLAVRAGEALEASLELFRQVCRDRDEALLVAVRSQLYDREEPYEAHAFDALARQAGWSTPIPQGHGAWNEATSQMVERVRAVGEARGRLVRLVCALPPGAEAWTLGLWRRLPPGSAKDELLRALHETRLPLPGVSMRDLLVLGLSPRVGIEDEASRRELEALAAEAEPRLRLDAIETLAGHDTQERVRRLLPLFAGASDELRDLLLERLRKAYVNWERVEDLPSEAAPLLSLKERARRNLPGWRAEVVDALGEMDQGFWEAMSLAVTHQIEEAVPMLLAHLDRGTYWSGDVARALMQLCRSMPIELRRRVVRVGWGLGDGEEVEALAHLLTAEDLDALSDPQVGFGFRQVVHRLGWPGHEQLLKVHRRSAARLVELKAAKAAVPSGDWQRSGALGRQVDEARRAHQTLTETVLACAAEVVVAVSEAVDVALAVGGGDVHAIYGSPGALGSDFMEPGDLDYHSSQTNKGEVKLILDLVQGALARTPDDWPVLRRLLDHPSESVRKAALELVLPRVPEHMYAEVAIEALEGQFRFNRTEWTGDVTGHWLGMHEKGAGNSYVEVPNIEGRLVSTSSSNLTTAHRGLVSACLNHELPQIRALGAGWCRSLGLEVHLERLGELLSDKDARVVDEALQAILVLRPEEAGARLLSADRGAWTVPHDFFVLALLDPRDRWGIPQPGQVAPADLGIEVVLTLLAEAENRPGVEGKRRITIFSGFPSLVERIAPLLDVPTGRWLALLQTWWLSADPDVVAVGRRLAAERGLLPASMIKALLESTHPRRVQRRRPRVQVKPRVGQTFARLKKWVRGRPWTHVPYFQRPFPRSMIITRRDEREMAARCSEVECAFRLSLGEQVAHLDRLMKRLRTHGHRAKEVDRRLTWALAGADVRFAPLVPLLCERLRWDSQEMCYEAESEALLAAIRERVEAWGDEGALALLERVGSSPQEGWGHAEWPQALQSTFEKAAKQSPVVLDRLGHLSNEGSAAARQWQASVLSDRERCDLPGLLLRLTTEVFPAGWPAADA